MALLARGVCSEQRQRLGNVRVRACCSSAHGASRPPPQVSMITHFLSISLTRPDPIEIGPLSNDKASAGWGLVVLDGWIVASGLRCVGKIPVAPSNNFWGVWGLPQPWPPQISGTKVKFENLTAEYMPNEPWMQEMGSASPDGPPFVSNESVSDEGGFICEVGHTGPSALQQPS